MIPHKKGYIMTFMKMPQIHTIDLNFQGVPHATAVYVIDSGSEGPVLVETGPGSTLNHCLDALKQLGIQPKDVRHVLLTHIHLDHAGAAGWWAQQGARVYVHYFGARHLIDPSKLLASATRIYGDKMDTLWGEMLPVPAERLTELYDNDTVNIGDLTFTALETPGHARHHHTYQLGSTAFTGDAAGLRLMNLPLVDIPAPPPEFDREVWVQTVDRLLAARFDTIYPTHFGAVTDVQGHLQAFRALIGDAAEFVRVRMEAGVSRDDLVMQYRDWTIERARAVGLTDAEIHQYETANPLYMSVDGIMRYWRKRQEKKN